MAKERLSRPRKKTGPKARSKDGGDNQTYLDPLSEFLRKNPKPDPNDVLAFWKWVTQILWFERPTVFTEFWTRVESCPLLSRLSEPLLYPPQKLHPIMFLLRDLHVSYDAFHGGSVFLLMEAVRDMVGAQQCCEVAANLLRRFNPREFPPSYGPDDLRAQVNAYRRKNRRPQINAQRQRFQAQVRARTSLGHEYPPIEEPHPVALCIYQETRQVKAAPNPDDVLAFWRWYTGEILWSRAGDTLGGFWERAESCEPLLSLCRVGGASAERLHPVFCQLVEMWEEDLYGPGRQSRIGQKRPRGRPKFGGSGLGLSILYRAVRSAMGNRGEYWRWTADILKHFFLANSATTTTTPWKRPYEFPQAGWGPMNLRGVVNYYRRLYRQEVAKRMDALLVEVARITSKQEIQRYFEHVSRHPNA